MVLEVGTDPRPNEPGPPLSAAADVGPRPAADRWERRPKGVLALALAALVIVFLASGLYQAAHDAPTVDEATDLSSGAASIVRHDLQLEPEHPPLPKVLAALPGLLAHPIIPNSPAFHRRDWFDYQADFLDANVRAGRLRSFLFLARLVPLLECIACAWCLWLLATRLVSRTAGAVAAGLWLTTPVVVGLGHFAMIDVPFTLTTLAFSVATLAFLERPSRRRAAVIGVTIGLSMAVRQTGVVLLPLAVAEIAWVMGRNRRMLAWAAGVSISAAVLTLWAIYQAISPGLPTGWRSVAITRSPAEHLAMLLPFPQQWRYGFTYLSATSGQRPVYLWGQEWTGSRWWFWPGTVLVKVPATAVLVLLVGPWFWRRLAPARRRECLIAVVAPAVVLLALIMSQPLNPGLRLVLPSLALWMVAASPIALALRRRWAQVLAAVVVVLQVVALVASTPHSLAWDPPPFRPSYAWGSESNDDFGQDAFAVQAWVARHRGARVIEADATAMPFPAGGRQLVLVDFPHMTGWVVVGASVLTERAAKRLSWMRAYCPVGTIGGTVLLYRFAVPPNLRPGPDRPASPCAGQRFSARVAR